MFQKSKKKNPLIIIIGNSKKFITIVRSIYKNSFIKVYSWRSLIDINYNQQKKFKNPNLIIICGYDYNSHWYSYKDYYKSNISEPIKFVNFLANPKTKILYIDTLKKVLNSNSKKNRFTFSRYEYAKKELGFNL